MTEKHTHAADIDATRDAAEMAKRRSLDSERAKAAKAQDHAERDAADALAASAGQSGQS